MTATEPGGELRSLQRGVLGRQGVVGKVQGGSMSKQDQTVTDRGFLQCPSCQQFMWIGKDGKLPEHEVWVAGASDPSICVAGRLDAGQWEQRTGIHVVSRDGWSGAFADVAWETPIERDEFLRRAMVSQTEQWPDPLLDERSPDLRGATKT